VWDPFDEQDMTAADSSDAAAAQAEIKADQDELLMAHLWEHVRDQQRQIAELTRMQAQEPPAQLLPAAQVGPVMAGEELSFDALEFGAERSGPGATDADTRAEGPFDLETFADFGFVASNGLGDLNLAYTWLDCDLPELGHLIDDDA